MKYILGVLFGTMAVFSAFMAAYFGVELNGYAAAGCIYLLGMLISWRLK